MGCCASKKAAEPQESAADRLERRRSTRHSLGTVVNPRVEADDDHLAKLGLALNDELEEGQPLTEEEETKLKEEIVAKLEDPSVMAAFDETSRVRIFRGMVTNNNGTDEENIAEAVETYGTVGTWLQENPDILTEKLPNEELLNSVMNTRIGGVDFQGHLVWCESLGDIAGLIKKGLTTEQAKACRMKALTAIRCAQIKACEGRGPRRYKNVYVMDLSKLSTMSMSSSSVREMAKVIVTGAGSAFPETAWKLFIVNAPFVFRSAYSVVKPLIHPVTRDKIKILGGKRAYLKKMQACGIPLSAVPSSMGGTYEDKSLERCLEELVADGFPRSAKNYVQRAEPEVVLSRGGSTKSLMEEEEAGTSTTLKVLGAVAVAATAFGGAVASGAVF